MPESPIAIVTDSTADIPRALVEQYSIQVVPNILILEGKSLVDEIDITRQEFYNRLPGLKSNPTTATASIGTYEKLYHTLLSRGVQHIVSMHASSRLSGIFNAASTAAAAFEGHVHVIDSEQVSLGLGFQVLAAAEAAFDGANLEKIIELIQHVRPRARVFAMLDTLEYVKRSGRVSWARARLGNLLSFKPFVELRNGQVFSLGETRTRNRGIERLKELLRRQVPFEKLAILHTNAEQDARKFLEDIREIVPATIQPYIVNVTTIIGAHTGPNGLGFAVILES
jgi:DegV family protein with EDD domain